MPILTFVNQAHAGHNPPAEYLHGHAVPYYESPLRIELLQSALLAEGLIDIRPHALIKPEVLAATHNPEMVAYLRNLSHESQHIIREDFAVYNLTGWLTDDEYYYESVFPAQMLRRQPTTRRTYIYDNTSPIGRGTWDAAISAASAAYAGAQSLLDGEQRVYALCRPPGHHATRDAMGGYCYLNNAAVAANHLKAAGRVAILDIDYHHGNGTQDIFWDDSGVFYVSLHADPALDYPHYTGFTGENHDTNMNIPLPHGTDDRAYLAALETAVGAVLAFSPRFLIVSLGFDIYRSDPMGRFDVHASAFVAIGTRLAALGLPTLYVQEGGYNLDMLGEMAVMFFSAIMEGV